MKSVSNLPICNFGNFQFWQLVILATCNFGNLQFWQLAILATCNFGNLQFWQLAILATCNFGNMQIQQFSILTTFSFDNFQFWLFSSKIFELIQEEQQQQQQHIDCMDLAIKKIIFVTKKVARVWLKNVTLNSTNFCFDLEILILEGNTYSYLPTQ